jgi:hypothetical protein
MTVVLVLGLAAVGFAEEADVPGSGFRGRCQAWWSDVTSGLSDSEKADAEAAREAHQSNVQALREEFRTKMDAARDEFIQDLPEGIREQVRERMEERGGFGGGRMGRGFRGSCPVAPEESGS